MTKDYNSITYSLVMPIRKPIESDLLSAIGSFLECQLMAKDKLASAVLCIEDDSCSGIDDFDIFTW